MTCNNKKQISILAVFSALSIVLTLSPVILNYNTNIAFAGGNDDDDDEGNSASQIIAQVQRSIQNSQVVSGGDVEDSGNNYNFQNQENSGSNAAAQNGGDDDDDGNDSNQGIGQNQASEQNAQCVSGEDAIVSCDNISFQNQVNSGYSVLAQD